MSLTSCLREKKNYKTMYVNQGNLDKQIPGEKKKKFQTKI